MKILLTGSAGFIGKHISRRLSEKHHVIGIDRGWDAREFFREDSNHYELVIHCAAVVGGRMLVESPLAHAENLQIDAGLFQWAERTKPGRIVYVSSVAAYPAELQMNPGVMLREDDIDLADMHGAPDELYGWAKLTGEFMASRSSVPVSVPRLFTVYGEGQDPVFPFANIAAQVRAKADPVTVWGTGNQVRDFIHVEDVADGITAMAGEGISGPVNFCTGRAVSLLELARMMASEAGYTPGIKTLPDKPEGLAYRVGDPAIFSKFYTPRISLEEGIRRTMKGFQ